MKVLRIGGRDGEAFVETHNELGKEGITCNNITYAREPELLHKSILQGSIHALYSTLGLARVRTQNLDVELGESPAELRHTGTALGIPVDAEHGVLVRVEGDGSTMQTEIA
jgi:hypothetical protein